MPITLTAVQAQQQENFAQELQKLYNMARFYIGQFLTGLQLDLKQKLIGMERSLEDLVLKVRFDYIG